MNRAYPKISIDKLHHNPDNPRFIIEEKAKLLQKSMNELSAMQKLRPIIVDENFMALGGNQRLDAARALGMKEVYYDMLTMEMCEEMNAEARAEGREERSYKYYCDQFVITDNSGFGEYDHELVQINYGNYPVEDWGYDAIEWDVNDDSETEDDSDSVPEIRTETDVETGDIIKIGHHTLICGDSTEEACYDWMNNDVDLLLTDPPYGVDYGAKNKYLNKHDNGDRIEDDIKGDNLTVEQTAELWLKSLSLAEKKMKSKSSFYIFIPSAPDLYMNLTDSIFSTGLIPKHTIIWNKNNHVLGMADYNYKHELILFGWKKGGTHDFTGNGEQKTTVWEYDKPNANKLHPTMKPIDLIANAIKNSSSLGDVVLDIFGGSGSTMIAAHQTGRTARLIEQKPEYCQVIIDRMIKLDGDLVVTINNVPYYGKEKRDA